MHGSLPLSPQHYLTRFVSHKPRATQLTHPPAVCLKRRIYRPGLQWSLIRAVLIRHDDWVFIKRGLRADSYDVEVRVYLFPWHSKEEPLISIPSVSSNRDRDLIIARGKRWSSGGLMYLEYQEIKIHFEVVYLYNRNFNNAFEFLGNAWFWQHIESLKSIK